MHYRFTFIFISEVQSRRICREATQWKKKKNTLHKRRTRELGLQAQGSTWITEPTEGRHKSWAHWHVHVSSRQCKECLWKRCCLPANVQTCCTSAHPFPETHRLRHQLTTVVHPPFAQNTHISWCIFHAAVSVEAKQSKMCMQYTSTHCFLFYSIYCFRWAAVRLWTINTGHAISTPCCTRNVQTSKWWAINWRGHNSFVNWQGWKKRNKKKRDVMGGKGMRNGRTRIQAVFQLVTALRRHQQSFPPAINNMALSVSFVARILSLSVSSTLVTSLG